MPPIIVALGRNREGPDPTDLRRQLRGGGGRGEDTVGRGRLDLSRLGAPVVEADAADAPLFSH